MNWLAWLGREIRGAYRSLRYDLGRRVDMSRADTDIMFPEYDAYERRPRRMRRAGPVTLFGSLAAGALVLAVTGGLGILLSGPAGGPQPAGPGGSAPTGTPSPSPSPRVVIGSPTPVNPTPSSPRARPSTRHPTATPPPRTTAPPTSTPPPTKTATPPTPTPTPTPTPSPSLPTPTPSPSTSAQPTPTTSTATATPRDERSVTSTLPSAAA